MRGRDPPLPRCHVPQEQRAGRQAGRPCTLFMAGAPPRTVNRGAGSWHRSSLRSEGPRSRLLPTSERTLRIAAFPKSFRNLYFKFIWLIFFLPFLPYRPDSTHQSLRPQFKPRLLQEVFRTLLDKLGVRSGLLGCSAPWCLD